MKGLTNRTDTDTGRDNKLRQHDEDNYGVRGKLGESTCRHQGNNGEEGGGRESRPNRRKEIGETGEMRPANTREESLTTMPDC
ncbi:hypothetical protein JTB14_032580 [Gonioctena quinquepunctata]|nr:hypothetical protein JTB14_032580 [Gonioctena quinquepunctata]